MFDNPINTGQRQVDNRSDVLDYFAAAPAGTLLFGNNGPNIGPSYPLTFDASNLIDTQGFLAYNLFVDTQVAANTAPLGGAPFPTGEVSIFWYNEGTVPGTAVEVATQSFENACGVGTPPPGPGGLTATIKDSNRARYMLVLLSDWFTSTGNPNGPFVNASLQLFSTPQDKLVISPELDDGFLLRTGSFSLNAGSSQTFICPTYSGAIRLGINGVSTVGTGAQGRLRGGFGAASAAANEIGILTAAALPGVAGATQFVDFPVAPNRPFMFTFANIGTTAGAFNVEVYALGT